MIQDSGFRFVYVFQVLLELTAAFGLGFVLWLDNQYMVATPWGRFKYGLLDAPGRQWLQIGHFAIEPQ